MFKFSINAKLTVGLAPLDCRKKLRDVTTVRASLTKISPSRRSAFFFHFLREALITLFATMMLHRLFLLATVCLSVVFAKDLSESAQVRRAMNADDERELGSKKSYYSSSSHSMESKGSYGSYSSKGSDGSYSSKGGSDGSYSSKGGSGSSSKGGSGSYSSKSSKSGSGKGSDYSSKGSKSSKSSGDDDSKSSGDDDSKSR